MTPTIPSVSPDEASQTPAYDACTTTEQAWVDAFFACGMNQTAASRSLKPDRSTDAAHKHGQRMSRNVPVKRAIQERLAAFQIKGNEVLYRIDRRARATADAFLRFDVVQVRPKIWVPVAQAIAEKEHDVEVERETNRRLELGGEEGIEADKEMARLERELVRLEVVQDRDPSRMVRIPGPVTERVEASFDLASMRDAGALDLVKSVKRLADGGFSVELHDAAHADDLLAKHAGLVGPTGTKDDPLHHQVATVTEIVFNTPEAGAAGDPDAD